MNDVIYIEEKKEFIVNGKVIKESDLSDKTKQQYLAICKKQKLINATVPINEGLTSYKVILG